MPSHYPNHYLNSKERAKLSSGTPIAVVGPKSLKDRAIGKVKELWKNNLHEWKHYPLQAAILNSTILLGLGFTTWAGAIVVNDIGLSEKPGLVQVEGRSFVPAHNEYNGRMVVHKDDTWYVSGKVQGQDPTQTVQVAVSQEEFQTDKPGDMIPVSFSTTRLTHALEARRATKQDTSSVQVAPSSPSTPSP